MLRRQNSIKMNEINLQKWLVVLSREIVNKKLRKENL